MKNFLFGILKALRVLLSAVAMIGLLFGSYTYLNKVFRNKEFETQGEYIQNLPANTLDVVTLGSSQAEYSFVPSFFYEETGLYSYTMASNCQPYEVSVEFLEEIYKRQDPKLIIMEVFTIMPLKDFCDEDGCYVQAQYKVSGQERYDILDYLPEEKTKEYYNEFLNYHNDWRTMENYEDLLPQNVFYDNKNLDPDSGYHYYAGLDYYPSNWWYALRHDQTVEVEPDPIDMESLDRIYEICKEHGSSLLLYKTPIDGIDVENQSYLYKVWDWANEHGVPYIDFVEKSREIGFFMGIHSDSFHANNIGAGLITSHLADYVNQMDIPFDHHDNGILNEVYKQSSERLMAWYMIYERHAVKITEMLKKGFEGYLFLRYLPMYGIDWELTEEFRKLGFEDFDPDRQYFAVMKDGELIASSDSYISYFVGDVEFYVDEHNYYQAWQSYAGEKDPLILAYYSDDLESRCIKEIDPVTTYEQRYAIYDYYHVNTRENGR